MRTPVAVTGAFLTLLLALTPATAGAAVPPVDPPAESAAPAASTELEDPGTVDADRISVLREELAGAELDEATAAQLDERLDAAASALSRRLEEVNARATFTAATELAADRLATLRAELAEPPSSPNPTLPADATSEDALARKAEADGRLTEARALVESLEAERAARAERGPAIEAALDTVRPAIGERRDALTAPGEDAPLAVRIDALTELAEIEFLEAQLVALEAERTSYAARSELLPARRARAARRVAEAEAEVEAWRAIVEIRRRAEAGAVADAARDREAALESYPVLRSYAADTARRAERLRDRAAGAENFAAWTRREQTASAELRRIRAEYRDARDRIERTGMNRATGLVLRRHLAELPRPGDLRRELRSIEQRIVRNELSRLDLADEVDALSETYAETERLVAEEIAARRGPAPAPGLADPDPDDPAASERPGDTALAEASRPLAAEIVQERLSIVSREVNDAERSAEALAALDVTTRELLVAASAYDEFIRERILWIQSITGARLPAASAIARSVEPLTEPDAWRRAGDGVLSTVGREWYRHGPSLLGVLILVWLSRKVHGFITRTTDAVGSFRTDRFRFTLEALGAELLLAARLPLLLVVLSQACLRTPAEPSITGPIGAGLLAAATALLPLRFFIRVVRTGGIAESHFRWPLKPVASVRRHLRWYVPAVVPIIAVEVAIARLNDDVLTASGGRIVFTALMTLQVLLLVQMLRRGGPIMTELRAGAATDWPNRLRWLWHPTVMVLPFILTLIAWLGWFYTARELRVRLGETVLLVVGMILANALMARWLFITRRTVAIENARRRRDEAAERARREQEAEAAAADGDGAAPAAVAPATEAPAPIDVGALDLPAISAQTRQLFRTAVVILLAVGLSGIWADALPALRALDRVQLWPNARIVEASANLDVPVLMRSDRAASPAPAAPDDPAGDTSGGVRDEGSDAAPLPIGPPRPSAGVPPPADTAETDDDVDAIVSLADVGFAAILLVLTVVAFRNVPGLVEIAILQRLPLDAGSRYAITTVIRYLCVIIGLVAAFGAIGLSWSKLQWLAAALTFGLAFGLQEIFANFISGLIILAERPIRVGDVVTVGNVHGTVRRIRMRATTITDFDCKELVVPNKTFITTDVINWTLSDSVLRVIVPVGVAYGSDVERVARILREIARDEEIVLEDPAPVVVFTGFGDSTLDHELRVFIGNVDQRVEVRHRLHTTIARRFAEADIEIAFPQRDLHLRSVTGLEGLEIAPAPKPRDRRTGD